MTGSLVCLVGGRRTGSSTAPRFKAVQMDWSPGPCNLGMADKGPADADNDIGHFESHSPLL
jgi:hypothetical protein